MKFIATVTDEKAVSDQTLRGIIEHGFFGTAGSLADARAACAELLFARSLIEAQTARIAALGCDARVATEATVLDIRLPIS